ncbi:MAG: hypothetical protein JSW68_05280 [Burkholderiales bacterium]|nr:MAG: hypothetical protein JSW68_05280 [Burkholderiales bacterium]
MPQNIPTTSADYDSTRIIERPDGYYWHEIDGGREYGPFQTLMDAVADMSASNESLDEVLDDTAEAVREAEELLGVPEWIDPDTG